MKFTGFVIGVVCATLLVTNTRAQTVTGSTNTSGSVQAGPRTTTLETKQDANVSAQRKNGRTETKADVQSHNRAQTEGPEFNLSNGAQLQAALKDTLDSKRVENGQQFLLRTTKDVKVSGQKVLKKGATLVGHVVAAQSKAEGEGRAGMTLMIDGIQQGNQIVPLQAVFVGMVQQTVQTTASSEWNDTIPTPSAPRNAGGGGLGGGVLGGATGAVSSTLGATGQAVGNLGNGAINGTLSSTANAALSTASNITSGGTINEPGRVLFSLQNGLTATSSASVSGATEFSRAGKDVKLEKGTEFLLAVTGSSRTSTTR